MQIVVPMSGFGERFRRAGYTIPKPLIEVEGKPIIAHVIDLFPGETNLIFICNEDHLAEPSFRMREILQHYCPSGKILPIAPHRLGPVYATLKAGDLIRDDEPVIVNYCDFTCYWDYTHFKNWTKESGCDGAIPVYRGFHPHSLGSTFYAYLREKDGWAYDIQEKKPFTDNPLEEYASSGTYYFASGALMKWAFDETLRQDLKVNGEYYVSLAYKPLFDAGKRVALYEIAHYMQWGTPQDLAEYNQYSQAFRLLAMNIPPAKQTGAMLLPMVGAGTRFASAGYNLPKPLIEVSGVPMAIAAAHDLPTAERQIFVLRQDLPHVDEIVDGLKEAYPKARIIMLPKLTEGQALTCLAAMDDIDPDQPLTIGACDNGLLYDNAAFEKLAADLDVDVIVWGYRGHASALRKPQSYGWIEAKAGVVTRVSVKVPLDDPAHDPIIVGGFTFKRARHFEAAAKRMIERDGRVNGEFYVDTCINDVIAAGLKVRLFEVYSYLCWGTPEELKTFQYWQSCFHKWKGHPYSLSEDGRVQVDQRVQPDVLNALNLEFRQETRGSVTRSGQNVWSKVPRSLKRFLVTGCTAVAIDGSTYFLEVQAGMEVSLAKAISFVTGAVFAYFAGRLWAFNDAYDARGSFPPYAILCLATLAVNVLVNKLSLVLLGGFHFGYQVSWLVATGCSATLNYVGMRFLVFRK